LTERTARINQFLQANGWGEADCKPLASDASFRRYIRLTQNGQAALLMDAPPPKESVSPFIKIAKHLHALGFSAPEIYAEDETHGLLLIEDFGEHTFTRLLLNGADETALYELATDTLIALHRLPADQAIPGDLASYDQQHLQDEAVLWADWYIPAVTGAPMPAAMRKSYVMAWFECFRLLDNQPQTLVLRDYHVDNLMRLDGRSGVHACGLLDFQDAVKGPSAYDLMSLLEDARRDISDSLRTAILNRYFNAFPELDRERFETAIAVLGAQRHTKVIGIFTRLCWRDGKSVYLQHIPRVWRLLERSLKHPALSPVVSWLDRNIPADQRITPPKPPQSQEAS
jgi:aminoglycoside/choline kinase family phosphotransferase